MGESASILLESMGQADAMRKQGEFAQAQAQMNARFAEMNAKDAQIRGNREAENVRTQARQMRGSQRAQMAAAGLSIEGDTSAAQVIDQTQMMGELDAQTVMNNAFKEAWGFRQEAAQSKFQGRMAMMSGNAQAQMTLATGGLRAYNKAAESAAKAAGGMG